jgi:ATP-binding cassette subfamily D (ALD) protein 3
MVDFVFSDDPQMALVNSLLKYGLEELKLRFRSRLSRHFYSRYMRGFTFYKMANLDNRISNADQLLTQDVEKFCDTLAELYSNISKPILDIVLYVYRLTGSIGAQGPLTMLGYLALSGFLLTKLRSPVGPMTAHEQHLEGQLRYVNSRIITNSEEISFYQGNSRERLTIYSTLDQLIEHLRSFVLFRFSMGFIDTMVAKCELTFDLSALSVVT